MCARCLTALILVLATARAEATLRRMLNQLQTDAGLETAEEAESALNVVLSSVVRRLTPGEAKDLIAQLPSLLQPKLYGLPPGTRPSPENRSRQISFSA